MKIRRRISLSGLTARLRSFSRFFTLVLRRRRHRFFPCQTSDWQQVCQPQWALGAPTTHSSNSQPHKLAAKFLAEHLSPADLISVTRRPRRQRNLSCPHATAQKRGFNRCQLASRMRSSRASVFLLASVLRRFKRPGGRGHHRYQRLHAGAIEKKESKYLNF